MMCCKDLIKCSLGSSQDISFIPGCLTNGSFKGLNLLRTVFHRMGLEHVSNSPSQILRKAAQ